MNTRLLALLATLLLSACAGGLRMAEPMRYDLGAPGGSTLSWHLPLGAMDVEAVSWLSTSAMHYRLIYAEPLRRQSFTESRWAAPPAELLEGFLKRRQAGAGTVGSGCRLQLVLDEFEQRFDDAQASHMLLELRAIVLPVRGSDMLARRAFRIKKPATSADARGGVAAAHEAANALTEELAAWTNDLARDRPALVERCRL
ncbi:MAG: membrane integrity-associated transporter subunit PqiC [Rhodocyclales bacterium]|nr:membrane integrity-associated transporter subunit PqiC [Rhodocyclales bacterium]